MGWLSRGGGHRTTIGLTAVLFVVVTQTAGPLAGQVGTVTIADDALCSTCDVGLQKVVTLGAATDSNGVMWSSSLAQNSEGHYYVANLAHPGEIYVYGHDGRYAGRIGRAGQGPGEFGRGLLISIDGLDQLHVIDNALARYTKLSPQHEILQTVRLPGRVRDFDILGAGRIVVQSDLGSPECFGVPLQVIGLNAEDGPVLRCFGADSGPVRRDRPHNRMRAVAASERGEGVWSARVNRYELAYFDSLGTQQLRITRHAPWFPGWDAEPPGAYKSVPPPPRIWGLAITPGGYLAIFALVPDSTWSPPTSARETPLSAASVDQYFDTVIEVLDPADGRMLGHLRHDIPLRPVHGTQLAYGIRVEPSGNERMDVYRLNIDPPNQPPRQPK